MKKSRFGGDLPANPVVNSDSATVDYSLKRRTWLLSAKYSVPPSKVQRGRVGIPGDFSVLEVRVAEITEGIYDLSPQDCSWCCLTVTESPWPPKGPPFDT